jgi:hypothetical protein
MSNRRRPHDETADLSVRRRAAERALYKRLVLTREDLSQVRAFLNRLMGLNRETRPADNDRVQKDALLTALVVSYARPFVVSEGSDALARLPDRFISRYSPSQREQHFALLKLRNQQFAHADSEPAHVVVYAFGTPANGSVAICDFTPIATLSANSLQQIDRMHHVLMTEIVEEMDRLEQGMLPGEIF